MTSRTCSKRIVKRMIAYLGVIFFAAVYFIPIYAMIISGFKSDGEMSASIVALPQVWSLDNFTMAIERMSLFKSLLNNIIICGGSIALLIVLSAMAAYPLAKKITKLNRFVYVYYLIGIIVPTIMMLVPLYSLLKSLHLINNYLGMILVYAAQATPYAVFMYVGFMAGISSEFEESAIIDGCSVFTAFWRIIFPLLKNATVTIAVLNLLGSWNDFIYPMVFLQKNDLRTLTVQLYFFRGYYTTSWAPLFAGMLFVSLPFIIIYFVGQKYIISGLTTGALKG